MTSSMEHMNSRVNEQSRNEPKLDVSVEWIEERLALAAYCAEMTIQGHHFRAIMDLAMRSKGFDVAGLAPLCEMYDHDKATLSGTQLRMLLMLASQAKRWNLRPRSEAVSN